MDKYNRKTPTKTGFSAGHHKKIREDALRTVTGHRSLLSLHVSFRFTPFPSFFTRHSSLQQDGIIQHHLQSIGAECFSAFRDGIAALFFDCKRALICRNRRNLLLLYEFIELSNFFCGYLLHLTDRLINFCSQIIINNVCICSRPALC